MLEVRDLSIKYYNQIEPLISCLSLTLRKGDVLWLKGKNGCGKTSVLYSICNVIPQMLSAERDGSIFFNDKLMNEVVVNNLAPDFSLLLSNPAWELFFSTIEGEIIFALENIGLTENEISERLSYVTDTFRLNQWKHLNTHHLSYGWQKMVNLAVHAAIKPSVLLLDEPLSGLSDDNKNIVLLYLSEYQKSGGIAILAEHSDSINELQPQIMCLDKTS